MRVTKASKFVALFDMHFGWEYFRSKGAMELRKTYAEPAIKAAMRFIKDYEPDILILGGDQLNCGPVSHWHHGKPRLTEDLRLKREMDILDSMVLTPVEKLAEKRYWMKGNHEAWIDDLLVEMPGLEGLVEPENYLELRQRGWKILEQGEILSIGKLHWVHGDVVLGRGTGKNPALGLVTAYNRNIRAGHLHTYSAAVATTPVDRKDFHTGIVVPSLSTRLPQYVKNNPTNFANGFEFGTIQPDGSFSDYVAVINKGRFEWNGKVYDGNK